MRSTIALLLSLPVALGSACANSTAIQESAGGSSTTGHHPGSSGTLTQEPDAGPRSCGVGAANPDCNACLEGSCCGPALDCANDPDCLACLGQPVLSDTCTANPLLQALQQCLEARCAEPCGLGGSSSSSGGAGGAGGAPSSSSSSSSSTSSSTSTSSSASSTSSSTSASSTSGTTSTSSSSTSSSSGGPLTCSSVDGAIGCCDADGVLHFCDTSQQVVDVTCDSGHVCGWSSYYDWYDCVPPPGGSDPGNHYPIACGP